MSEKKLTPEELNDLLEQRAEFVDIFFRKGAEFANQLIGELESLKHSTEQLSHENVSLKTQLASDDAIRDLLGKIEHLESEKKRLTEHAEIETGKYNNYAARYQEVEQELDTMASLYVALHQLHSTLAPQEVLGVIEQMLAQFVGAGSFVIYLRRGEGGAQVLAPVHAYHCEGVSGEHIPWNEGPIGEAAATQVHSVADPGSGEPGAPLACIPMVLGERTIGVIALMGFFEQKNHFVEMDFQFFKLLAIHSASAIVGSGLMARAGDIDSSLESYPEL